MTAARGEEHDLTGTWQGLYSYPVLLAPNPFTAILIQSGAGVSGTIHEPCMTGPARGTTLYAMLSGTRAGSDVSFIKTYDGTAGWRHTVKYRGKLSPDGTEIEGRWRIGLLSSGKFLMIRASTAEAAEERQAIEPADTRS